MKRFLRRLIHRSRPGYCTICETNTRFLVYGRWYRDQLLCERCFSIPRERALMRVIQMLYPGWRDLRIHESSPGDRGASRKFRRECSGYVGTQYPDVDLEKQGFADETFDLVITQDVFEHVFHPDRAIAEIVRTLKPGGAHIMSVPIVRKEAHSRRRASLGGGEIVHHQPPEYHDNPVDPRGSLVTIDWGYDIGAYLTQFGGPTTIYSIDNRHLGITAEYIEIVVTRKDAAPAI